MERQASRPPFVFNSDTEILGCPEKQRHQSPSCAFSLSRLARGCRDVRGFGDQGWETLSIEIDPATLDALDRLIDGHTISSRPDAIRFILKRWLEENQKIDVTDQEGTRPEDLNASNDD